MTTHLETAHASLGTVLNAELDALARQQLRRSLRVLDPATGPVIQHQGRSYLHFASNDYLGLAADPRVIRAAEDALHRYGLGSSSSRLMSGTSPLHQQLEERLAQFLRQEAALVFSSGYLTNIGLITALTGAGDVVICDHANHASLIDGCRLSRATLRVYPHADVARLRQIVQRSASARRRLMVTDGVFSMDGDVAPLRALAGIAAASDSWLLVDDAHGNFVIGAHGRGSLEACDVATDGMIRMGTLGKALGSLGGYVAGPRALIDYLVNCARTVIYATALPPAVAAGALAALDIVEQEPDRRTRVLACADQLRQGLRARGWNTLNSTTQIVPVVVGGTADVMQLAQQLDAAGIFAPAIRPPTVPRGRARIRLSVTAHHTPAHIDRCLDAFAHAR